MVDEPGVSGRFAFPRQERLTRRSEYLSVYAKGRKQVDPSFICYTTRAQGQGRKFGFAVSRKVGTATVRNRIKRYLREIYRTHRPVLRDDVQVVLVARPHAVNLDYLACERAVRRLLEKGDAWRG